MWCPGRLTTHDLREKIKDGGGKAELKTAEGETLTVMEKDGKLWLKDAKGSTAEITISNVLQSNGVIQRDQYGDAAELICFSRA